MKIPGIIFFFSLFTKRTKAQSVFFKKLFTLYKINLVKILERRNSIEISTPKNPSIAEKKKKGKSSLSIRKGRGFQVAG